jgi:hypothetical protein
MHTTCILCANTWCLNIPNYSNSMIQCPSTTSLPRIDSLVSYYDGESVILPMDASVTHSVSSVIQQGRLGNTTSSVTTVNFGSQFLKSTSSISLSMFVKKTSVFVDSSLMTIAQFSLVSGGTLSVSLQRSDSRVNVVVTYLLGTNSQISATAYLCENSLSSLYTWNHIAFVQDGTQLALFVNGIIQSIVLSGSISSLSTSSTQIAQSGHSYGSTDTSCLIDELSLFSTALSSSDVNDLYRVYDSNCASWIYDGAPEPVISVSFQSKSLAIAISFVKSLDSSDKVNYRISSNNLANDVCLNGTDNAVPISGRDWVVDDDSYSCLKTFYLTQSMTDIYSGHNDWKWTLSPDGKTIIHQLPIYSTYSIRRNGHCTTVEYQSTVQFNLVLLPYSESDFVSSDNIVRFSILQIYVQDKMLIVNGILKGIVAGLSFQNIKFQKKDGTLFNGTLSTCSAASGNVATCSISFSALWSTLNSNNQDISGDYVMNMDAVQQGSTVHAPQIDMGIDYIVPVNPGTVTTGTAQSMVNIYSDGTYSATRTSALKTTDTMYIENSLTSDSPVIPSSLMIDLDEGYLCCVPVTSSISNFDPISNTGGCKTRLSTMSQYIDLKQAISQSRAVFASGSSSDNRKYRIQVPLNKVFTLPISGAQTCQILLISKFSSIGAKRRLATSFDPTTARVASLSLFDLESSNSDSTQTSRKKLSTTTIITIACAASATAIILGCVLVMSIVMNCFYKSDALKITND